MPMRSSGFSQQETPPDATSGIFCQHPANGSARHLPLPKRPPPADRRSARRLPLPIVPRLHNHSLHPPSFSSRTPYGCTTTAPPVAFRYPSSRACTTTASIRLLSLPVRPTHARLPLRPPPSSSHTPPPARPPLHPTPSSFHPCASEPADPDQRQTMNPPHPSAGTTPPSDAGPAVHPHTTKAKLRTCRSGASKLECGHNP